VKDYIAKLASGKALSATEISEAFQLLLSPETGEEAIQAFLRALAKIKVTPDLLTGAAQVFLEHATPVHLTVKKAMDQAGTGGDQSGSFNFSTASSLLVAACGAPVAKHGNRSITSQCGSADVLEALGIPIDLGPEAVARSVAENNFGFMMAPNYHPATKRVQQIRRRLGLVTVFNFLGPLLNPARVKRQLLGVYDNDMRPVMAEALRRLGTQKTWVVWGEGGLDEVTLTGKTFISEVTPEGIYEKVLEPEDAVLRKCDIKFLKGGDAAHNAKLMEGIFAKTFFGPLVNMTLLNAGAALVVADQAEDIKAGVQRAKLALEQGEALELLEKLKKSS